MTLERGQQLIGFRHPFYNAIHGGRYGYYDKLGFEKDAESIHGSLYNGNGNGTVFG